MIPYGKQEISEADIEAVIKVLRSERITQGEATPAFEEALARYTGATHAIAVNSGTSALHLACLALGLGPGDRLWTSPLTYVASANCARYCGAEVDFVDIDPVTGNLSIQALKSALQAARDRDELPRVVVAVHFAGHPCDMPALHALAGEYGFSVLEDASHALGARDSGGVIGHCRYSEAAVFSFHPVKSITTGEGGAIMTNDADLAGHLERLRSHGITRDPGCMRGVPAGPWYYEQIELGYNYRLTDLQAALGRSQLTRLDNWVAQRNRLSDRYDEALADLPLILPVRPDSGLSACHLYSVRLDQDSKRARAEVFNSLQAAGIGVNVHYIPVHLQPYYRDLGFAPGMYPQAEAYYQAAITLPLYPSLDEADQDRVIATLTGAITA